MQITCVNLVQIPANTPINSHYYPNRAPLQAVPFQKLPPRSIKPNGWLLGQLRAQLNGLNGQLWQISDYLVYEQCGWVDPNKSAWEELPYWLKGFTDLALITNDAAALTIANRWIDGILSSQQEDGWFGPNSLRTSLEGGPDLWPAMPLLSAFRSLYECTNDGRVIPFLLKYFEFIYKQPAEVFHRGWSDTRWSDNIDSIIWLYNRTIDSEWLVDLIRKIHANSANWINDLPTLHNVNLAQGFREPALYFVAANPVDPTLIQATYNDYQLIMTQFGQFPGGGFAGDENCRTGYGDPRQGIETCGIVEFMHSFQILTRITGDGIWADRCETLAFNSLPAALDPIEARALHYITCANCIVLDNQAKSHGQFSNNWPMLAYKPGVHEYRCCAHNHGMGWPYYAEECWLATYDGGLCASLYVSSEVTALVGPDDGTQVTIIEETDYPFDDTIKFRFQLPKSTQFKLYLRMPIWCNKPSTIVLNGETIFHEIVAYKSSYIIFDRVWSDNDILAFTIPMNIRTRVWDKNNNSMSVYYGPMTFSLAIAEQYNRIGGTNDWPEYEVIPKSPWNYGLILSQKDQWQLQKRKNLMRDCSLFTSDTVPLKIEVQARRIPQWTSDSENVVGLLPVSPVLSSEPDETILLIPMGAARLRITAFPTIKS